MKLPNNYIRGILNSAHLCDGFLTTEIFLFSESKNCIGYDETSINWCDDDNVQEFSLQQKKDTGEPLFGYGVAVLDTDALNTCIKQFKNYLGHERRALDGNPYHGNILLIHGVKPQIKRLILNQLLMKGKPISRE